MIKNFLKKIVLFVLVVSLTFSITGCNNSSKINGVQSRGNIHAGASFLYYEGYYFFTNDNNIYRIKEDTKDIEIIHTYGSNLGGVDYIDIADGWLYFKDFKSPDSRSVYLWKMRPNGEDAIPLASTTGFTGGAFRIVDGYIYFGCEGKYSIAEDKMTRIYNNESPTASTVNIYEDRIYFCEDSKIYSITTDGEDATLLLEVATIDMIVDEGWIYYIDRYKKDLYKMKTDGSELQLMRKNVSHISNFDDEWLYVAASIEGESGSYKLKKDGTEYQFISAVGYIINGKRYVFEKSAEFKPFDLIFYEINTDESKEELFRINIT